MDYIQRLPTSSLDKVVKSVIKLIQTSPHQRVCILTDQRTKIIRYHEIFSDMVKQIPEWYLDHKLIKETRHQLNFDNGSSILFLSDVMNCRGYTFDVMSIDSSANFSTGDLEHILPRLSLTSRTITRFTE